MCTYGSPVWLLNGRIDLVRRGSEWIHALADLWQICLLDFASGLKGIYCGDRQSLPRTLKFTANPPQVHSGAVVLFVMRINWSPLFWVNLCSLWTHVRRVMGPPLIHQNSSPRIRSGLVCGELFESPGLRQESAMGSPPKIRGECEMD